MKLGFMKRILTNNGRYKQGDYHYREVCMVNLVLLGLSAVCFFYMIANILIAGSYDTAIVNALFSAFSLMALIYFHKTDHLKSATYLAVILLLATLVVYFAIAENGYYSLYWIAVFPPVAYFLLGRRKAILISSLFFCYMLFYILLKMPAWQPAVFDYGSIFNITGGTFTITLIVSFYEKSMKDAEAELKKTNAILEDNRNELRLILDSAAEGIYGIDRESRCTFCNVRCLELLGYNNEEDLIGKNMHSIVHHSHRDGRLISTDECKILNAIRSGKAISFDEDVFWRADGTYIDVEYYSSPKFSNGAIIGAVVTFMDISNRKRNEEKVRYLSRHDSLTGLVNRRYFEEQLDKYDDERQLPLSVIFADLNELKLTNDIYGHAAGDSLLMKTAAILKKNCREKDIIARTGGDEFVMLLPNTGADEAIKIINKIRNDLSGERIHAIKCSMALGSDTRTSMDQDIRQVMKNAEIDMYLEKTLIRKQKGRDTLQEIMNNLHERSPREKSHSETTRDLCRKMGIALGWNEADTRKLMDAGYYHDIGKIVLSNDILNKTDLNHLENNEIQQHVIIGYRILNLFDTTLDLAEIVYSHHENWDGTGYPKGLKGEEIPIQSRIIAVAEQFDFLTSSSNPNYCSKEEALEEIRRNSEVKFDPKIVEVFLKTMSLQHPL